MNEIIKSNYEDQSESKLSQFGNQINSKITDEQFFRSYLNLCISLSVGNSKLNDFCLDFVVRVFSMELSQKSSDKFGSEIEIKKMLCKLVYLIPQASKRQLIGLIQSFRFLIDPKSGIIFGKVLFYSYSLLDIVFTCKFLLPIL